MRLSENFRLDYFQTTETLLARGHGPARVACGKTGQAVLPNQVETKLSPGQTRRFLRDAQALSERTGLDPQYVVKHLLIELSLLVAPCRSKVGKSESEPPRPNRTSALTNIRDHNVFEIQATFDGILDAFKGEPSIARTAACYVAFVRCCSIQEVPADTREKRQELSGAISGNALLMPYQKTILTALMCGKYDSVANAISNLRLTIASCTALFSSRPETKRNVGTAIASVFLRQYKSPWHAFFTS